ncbi:carboxypeptidase-like regulatory domain-containing protein [Myxococcus sp. RHSTA-1-4]|uniref:carboxypeptidase-like regulatory domain-containing protein n=1 Tax=Myxococcus sp. RHSTA-1-4 TaxID=2874601 RepID=UPI001CBE20A8|nr:carboxypeptidase-like regulatory domain-containing protein [Myxococcus sp. RHSTA-1-4]MBZ4415497.1 carboxypeptidase-like regulatory domain-containing protein [Myxococcus sp. RHSTA-1-4]
MRPSVILGLLLLLPTVALGSRVSGSLADAKSQPFTDAALEVVREPQGKVVARGRTGPEGQFSFNLPPGDYRLRVRTPELCAVHEVALEVKDEDLASLPTQLPRCVRVTGRALGAGGAPLAGGRVTLDWLNSEEPDQTATTDAEGRFELPRASQGAVRVSLVDASGRDLLSRTRLTAPRELEVRGARMHQVLVRGPTGAPLKNAEVLLVPEARNGTNQLSRTDARGLANFPVWAPGRYRLLASWEQEDRFRRSVWRDVELKGDPEETLPELSFAERPASATLQGRVHRPDGRPFAGSKVTAVQRFPSVPLDDDFLRDQTYSTESATTLTDAEGNFVLRDLREGEYVLTAEPPLGSRGVLARTGGPPVDMSVMPSCASSASGRVVDEQGAPVRSFRVLHERVKNEEGRFHSNLGCHLFIWAEGFLPRWLEVPASTTEHVSLPDVVLVRGRQLEGKVVHPDRGPQAGITLTAEWKGSQESVDSKPTDAAGRFSLGPVPRDRDVVLTTKWWRGTLRQRVSPKHKGEVTFRLPASETPVLIHALSAEGLPHVGIEVTAENADGVFKGHSNDSHEVSLKLPPGAYEIRVVDTADSRGPRAGLPARFAPLKVQVPAKGAATVEVRATRGTGALRVLLPRPSHYRDVYVVPGARPWPGDLDALASLPGTLEADAAADGTVDLAAPDAPFIPFNSVLKDFSQLVPGTYTVFARNSYGGTLGRSMLFRKVIEVGGPKRQVVQVRFEGPDARELPWW